jgi:hypothetical protein
MTIDMHATASLTMAIADDGARGVVRAEAATALAVRYESLPSQSSATGTPSPIQTSRWRSNP